MVHHIQTRWSSPVNTHSNPNPKHTMKNEKHKNLAKQK
jgi:hypothetical protein